MSWELIYTSAPRGLKPNSSGFCTVAVTAGMSRAVMQKLENLSAYEFHYKLSDPNAEQNPANFLHTRLLAGGKKADLLSRIAFAGADYTGRANKIAHHVLLASAERLDAGPAAMMQGMAGSVFSKSWTDPPKELPRRHVNRLLRPGGAEPAPARAWEQVAGDAGWAGMLLKAFMDNPRVPAYVVFAPGMDILSLYAEALALLTPERRWDVCFSTYHYGSPMQVDCEIHWRAVLAGSKAAKTEPGKYPNALLIDLTSGAAAAPDNAFTIAAREGRTVSTDVPPARQAVSTSAAVDIRQMLGKERTPDLPDEESEPDTYELAKEEVGETAPWSERDRLAALASQAQPSRARPSERRRWPTGLLVAAVVILLLTNALTLSLFLGAAGDRDRLTEELEIARASSQQRTNKSMASDGQGQTVKTSRPSDANEPGTGEGAKGKTGSGSSRAQDREGGQAETPNAPGGGEEHTRGRGNQGAGKSFREQPRTGDIRDEQGRKAASPKKVKPAPTPVASADPESERSPLRKEPWEKWKDKTTKHARMEELPGKGGLYYCKIAGADVFITLPREMNRVVRMVDDDGKTRQIYRIVGATGRRERLAECWISNAEEGEAHLYMRCADDRERKLAVPLRSLTIAVGNSKADQRYLCYLSAEQAEEQHVALAVGRPKGSWRASWSCHKNSIAFVHAWPTLLGVRAKGRALGSVSSDEPIVVNLGRWTANVKAVEKAGQTVTVVLPDTLPREIEESLRRCDERIRNARGKHRLSQRPFPWERWWAELDGAYGKAETNANSCDKEMRTLEGKKRKKKEDREQIVTLRSRKAGWDSVLAALKCARGLRDQISGAFQKSKLRFLDPMDRPIHEIRFKLNWGDR